MGVRNESIGYFVKLNKSLTTIGQKMLESNPLCKLLHYNDNDPFSHPDLTDDEKVELLNNKIRLIPKVPFNDIEGSFVIVAFDKFSINDYNPKFLDQIISISVFSHMDQWTIKNGMRPFFILEEIHSILENSNLFGIGRVHFVSGAISALNEEIIGYTVKYVNIDFDSNVNQ